MKNNRDEKHLFPVMKPIFCIISTIICILLGAIGHFDLIKMPKDLPFFFDLFDLEFIAGIGVIMFPYWAIIFSKREDWKKLF